MKLRIAELLLYLSLGIPFIVYLAVSGGHWAIGFGAVVPLVYAAMTGGKIYKLKQTDRLAQKPNLPKAVPDRTTLLSKEQVGVIEERFSLELPREYVSLLTEDKSDYGLLYLEKRLIEENEGCREVPVFSDYWDDSWFAIHADGCGNVYFITTAPYDGNIYDYDHEQTFPGYEPLKHSAFESMELFLRYLRAHGMDD